MAAERQFVLASLGPGHEYNAFANDDPRIFYGLVTFRFQTEGI